MWPGARMLRARPGGAISRWVRSGEGYEEPPAGAGCGSAFVGGSALSRGPYAATDWRLVRSRTFMFVTSRPEVYGVAGLWRKRRCVRWATERGWR